MTTSEDKTKGWSTIYPIHIDAEKGYDQGRKIPKDKAVAEPTAIEIYDICKHLKLECVLQVCFHHNQIVYIR
jgi:signal recognition particle subunit SEC65